MYINDLVIVPLVSYSDISKLFCKSNKQSFNFQIVIISLYNDEPQMLETV